MVTRMAGEQGCARRLAEKVQEFSRRGQIADESRKAIQAADVDAVVAALIDLSRQTAASEAVAISDAMRQLEAVADVDQVLAGCLMARLYYRASNSFLYEVCDAVDLWMHQFRSPELGARRLLASRGDARTGSEHDSTLPGVDSASRSWSPIMRRAFCTARRSLAERSHWRSWMSGFRAGTSRPRT